MDILIIGGGASGLISAIYAKKNNNNVTILEKNKTLGKKLLITGNGKCNYWNNDININHYQTSNLDILDDIISKNNQEELLTFFDSIGIVPRIKNGYYYPYSNISVTILNALLIEIKRLNINVINDIEVTDIIKEDKFIVKTNKGDFTSDKVILSTGSKATPKTGSDGVGYTILSKLGHTINDVNPALVGLLSDDSCLSNWAGIRIDGEVTLYSNNKVIAKDIGEIQLNNDGISGIPVMNISGRVGKLNNIEIGINFLPNNIDINYMDKRNDKIKDRTIIELLESIINYKLLYIIFKRLHMDINTKWDQLSNNDKIKLFNNLTDFRIKITGTRGYDYAQICTGGVPLNEVNLNMESKIIKNLYIVGELLDADGECGGFNLGFAFITGMLAGKD